MEAPARTYGWPSLRVADWTPTRDTLHMWAQIVGKIRLAHMPLINHWWQVTFYASPRGLTTGAIPYGTAVFDMEFDFVANVLAIRHSDGSERSVPLVSKPVAEFYGETLSLRWTVCALRRGSSRTPTRSTHRFRSPKATNMPRTTPTLHACSGSNWCRPTV
jgi:Family of unknown function (DUF5996)